MHDEIKILHTYMFDGEETKFVPAFSYATAEWSN